MSIYCKQSLKFFALLKIMKLHSSCSGCFAGLSCDTRIDIINLLQKKGPTNVMEIAKHFKVTQPTITHHLKYLKELEILKSEKKGRQIFYSVDSKCTDTDCGIFP